MEERIERHKRNDVFSMHNQNLQANYAQSHDFRSNKNSSRGRNNFGNYRRNNFRGRGRLNGRGGRFQNQNHNRPPCQV